MNKLRFKRTGKPPIKVTGWILASGGDIFEGRSQDVHIARTCKDKYIVAIAEHSCYSGESDGYYAEEFDHYENVIDFLEQRLEPMVLDELIEIMEYK